MKRATTKRRKLFGSARTSRGAAKPVPLGDRGAVAFEFALIFPLQPPGRVNQGPVGGAISVAAADIVLPQSPAVLPYRHSGRPDHGSIASQSDYVHDADVAGIRKCLLADTPRTNTPGNNPVSEVRCGWAAGVCTVARGRRDAGPRLVLIKRKHHPQGDLEHPMGQG